MTALGAAIYGGFFTLAAIWLVMTGEGERRSDRQAQ